MRLVPLVIAASTCEPILSGHPAPDGDTAPTEQVALVVSPATLDFGTLSVNDDVFATADFTITNAGTESVVVHGQDEVVYLASDPDQSQVFQVAADPIFELAPGHSQDLQVVFRPSTDAGWQAEVRVNYGIEVLTLIGQGQAPVLALDDADPPSTPVGCEHDFQVQVQNTGTEPLVLADAWLSDDTHYALDSSVAGTTIAPGASTSLPLRFAPVWDGAGGEERTTLYVQSNDPLTPIASRALLGVAYEGAHVTDRFIYAPGGDADVLFVVDTDGVMQAHLDKAVDAAGALIDGLDDGNIDAHIAVLTGDSPCPITAEPYSTSDELRSTRVHLLQDGLQGPSGVWSDQLLGLATQGLSEGCLAGLLRPGAQLHVVAIAGEADASGESADSWLEALRAHAPDASAVVVSAVIVTTSEGCGGASYGQGYAEAALTSGGEIRDLCEPDWTDSFSALAMVSTLAGEGGLVHTLEHPPLADTLEVRVDGMLSQDWSYEDQAVIFDPSTAPEAGSTVEIDYVEAVDCEGS